MLNRNAKDIHYRLQYVERNQRSKSTPWSFRHTGVYHLHKPDFDFFLLVHSTSDSAIEQQLIRMTDGDASSEQLRNQVVQNPSSLHNMLLAAYSDNWQALSRDYDKQIAKTVSRSNRSSSRNRVLIAMTERSDPGARHHGSSGAASDGGLPGAAGPAGSQ